jgi:hypothetical protein
VRASASHERRDSGVGIAEGALEHDELVAVARAISSSTQRRMGQKCANSGELGGQVV